MVFRWYGLCTMLMYLSYFKVNLVWATLPPVGSWISITSLQLHSYPLSLLIQTSQHQNWKTHAFYHNWYAAHGCILCIGSVIPLLFGTSTTGLVIFMITVIVMNISAAVSRGPVIALMPDIVPPEQRSPANGWLTLWGFRVSAGVFWYWSNKQPEPPIGFLVLRLLSLLWQHLLSTRPSMSHGMPFITSRKLKKHLGGRTLAPFWTKNTRTCGSCFWQFSCGSSLTTQWKRSMWSTWAWNQAWILQWQKTSLN